MCIVASPESYLETFSLVKNWICNNFNLTASSQTLAEGRKLVKQKRIPG